MRRSVAAMVGLVAALVGLDLVPASAVGAQEAAGQGSGSTVDLVVTGDGPLSAAEIAAATGGRGDLARSVPEIGLTVVAVPADRAAAATRALSRVAGVESARRDAVVHADDVVPTDPYWPAEVNAMQRIGAPAAWSSSTGSAAVTIAVVDSGVTETPDLNGRVLTGWDFVNGDADPSDDDGHGTATALVAAAAGNDGTGTAGMCWSCRVLPVKVLDQDGAGTMSDVAAGIVWAADHGADVINLSLGGDSWEPSVAAALRYATDRDIVIVASAGNDGRSEPSFPAAADGVIAVGGLATDGSLHPQSRRGPTWVDLAAPWCNVIAPYTTSYTFCGTSASAPLVSGAAALLRAMRPSADRSMVTNALVTTAVFGPTAGAIGYGTLDAAAAASAIGRIGPGPIVAPPDVTAPTAYANFPTGYVHDVTRIAISSADDQRVAQARAFIAGSLVASVSSPASVQSLEFDTRGFSDGVYPASADAVDAAGHVASVNGTVTIDNAPPVGLLTSPTSGTTQSGSFVLRVFATDPNGVMGTFLIANDRVVGGYTGNGWGEVTVPITKSGRIVAVAITVDNAGHIVGTNAAIINGRAARRRR